MSNFDYRSALSNAAPDTVAALMNSGSENQRLWRPEEIEALMRHQLSAPVLVDLGSFDPARAESLRKLSDAQGLILKSFGELFRHPLPPVELLELTKNFAKANMDSPASGLPRDLFSAIYFASIATALVRNATRISKLGDRELHRGFAWALDQPWIDPELKGLFESARKTIGAAS